MSYQSNVDVQLIAQALAVKPGLRRIVVGLSGGLDSTALLHLTHQWWLQQPAMLLRTGDSLARFTR